MFMDKGYYDYDFESVKERHTAELKPKSASEVSSMLARFGFNTKLKSAKNTQVSAEQLQLEIMEEEKKKHGVV